MRSVQSASSVGVTEIRAGREAALIPRRGP